MKKILFLINVDWFFISHRLPIAFAAMTAGYEVHIATGITDKKTELENYGFNVHALPLNRGKTSISNELSAFKAIINIIKTVKPDLLHLITIKPVLYGGLAARFLHKRSIVVAISGLGYIFTTNNATVYIRRLIISLLYRIALKHNYLKVIFQNHNDQQILSQIANLENKQTILIPGSGVDLNKFTYQPELSNSTVIIMVARLLKDKGIQEFIDAAIILIKRYPNVTFQLVGTIDPDNPASITQQQVEEWKKSTHIQILGQRNDIQYLFSQAHIVVLPSYREGFPKVLIEAAACGRAVVTTDVPGCRDAIIANTTGLLVPVRNTSELSNAIEYLIVNKEIRQQMGKAARKLAEEKYDIKQVVKTHLQIYQNLLDYTY